jgi:hypothetical protein
MPTPPGDSPSADRPRVRVVILAARGGAVALAAALGFGLAHAAPAQDDAAAAVADDATSTTPDEPGR